MIKTTLMAQSITINRSGQPEVKRRPLAAASAVGGNRMPCSRRESSLFGSLRKEATTAGVLVRSCSSSGGSGSGSDGLDLDRLHVLKVRHTRDRESSTKSMNPSAKDIKFSKYSPLPAIKTRPHLIREKTYDVLEPIYVKGPIIGDGLAVEPPIIDAPIENRTRLPEIRSSNRMQTSKLRKPQNEILIATTNRKELTNKLQSNHTPHLPVSNSGIQQTTVNTSVTTVSSIRQKSVRQRQPFNPNLIAKAPMPESPTTVFWFPV